MSIERVYHCDGPDCETHARTAARGLPRTFLRVTETEGGSLHFCSWDCVMRLAATFPPTEVIPAGGDE